MWSLSKPWHAAVATLGVTVLASCASTDYHFSQLYGQRHNRAPIDTYDVTIVRVDGKDTPLRPVLVDPGIRKVVVQGPTSGGSRLGEQLEIALEVRPCTRYYLVAVKPNSLAVNFDVRVDYEEPVGGCTPPVSG